MPPGPLKQSMLYSLNRECFTKQSMNITIGTGFKGKNMPVSPDPKMIQYLYSSYTVQYKNKSSSL